MFKRCSELCVLLLCVEAFLPHGADDGRVRAQVRGRALGGHERDRRTETEHTARLTELKSTDPQHSNRQQTDGADSWAHTRRCFCEETQTDRVHCDPGPPNRSTFWNWDWYIIWKLNKSAFHWCMVCYDRTKFGWDTTIWKSGIWGCKKIKILRKSPLKLFKWSS